MRPGTITAILLTTLATVVVTVWCAAMARVFGVENKDFAAWAQAIGSIAAIGAAIWAANHQVGAQTRAANRARRDEIAGIGEAEALAYDSFAQVRAGIAGRDLQLVLDAYAVMEGERWQPLKRFADMPVERWPSAKLFARTIAFNLALDNFSTGVTRAVNSWVNNIQQPPDWELADAVQDRLNEAHRNFTTELEALLKD